MSGEGKSRYQKHGNLTGLLKEKSNSMLIETDWLNVLVDRGEHKGYIIQADQV